MIPLKTLFDTIYIYAKFQKPACRKHAEKQVFSQREPLLACSRDSPRSCREIIQEVKSSRLTPGEELSMAEQFARAFDQELNVPEKSDLLKAAAAPVAAFVAVELPMIIKLKSIPDHFAGACIIALASAAFFCKILPRHMPTDKTLARVTELQKEFRSNLTTNGADDRTCELLLKSTINAPI